MLVVTGADLLDGTPIFDIKPYLPYTDAHPDALGGFALQQRDGVLRVDFPPELLAQVPPQRREALLGVLAQDPRPGYQDSPDRLYWLAFGGVEAGFTVAGDLLTVRELRQKG